VPLYNHATQEDFERSEALCPFPHSLQFSYDAIAVKIIDIFVLEASFAIKFSNVWLKCKQVRVSEFYTAPIAWQALAVDHFTIVR